MGYQSTKRPSLCNHSHYTPKDTIICIYNLGVRASLTPNVLSDPTLLHSRPCLKDQPLSDPYVEMYLYYRGESACQLSTHSLSLHYSEINIILKLCMLCVKLVQSWHYITTQFSRFVLSRWAFAWIQVVAYQWGKQTFSGPAQGWYNHSLINEWINSLLN
jgi:hypothetical protein